MEYRENKISGKNAEIANFYAVLLLSRLYLISYFRFRMRLCVVCARMRELSTRFRSVLFTLTDRVHWFTGDEHLILLKVLILIRSILLFFSFFFLFQSFDHTIANERNIYICLRIIYIVS